jgi:beta-1,4-mannosyl-glycoprotein beta-1,4-N-acetylglucosaminyltransferase
MKIIDCFTFYNELDMLELRLNELNKVVDYFVLVECVKTHANNDKELYFENNKDRFTNFLDKIIHIIVKDNIPQTSNAWDIENYQRRGIDQGIKQLNLNSDDIIIITDLDEIPDADTLQHIKNTDGINGVYSMEMDLYYYNLNCKCINKWYHAKILNFGNYNNDPQSVRDWGSVNGCIKNGGWHLSYFGDVEFIKNKIKNFAHQEFNNDFILNDERILKQIQGNGDLYGRDSGTSSSFNYIDIHNNTYLPHKYKEFTDFLFKK